MKPAVLRAVHAPGAKPVPLPAKLPHMVPGLRLSESACCVSCDLVFRAAFINCPRCGATAIPLSRLIVKPLERV